jgi:hypothetical protein
MKNHRWAIGSTEWTDGATGYISIPFTWLLPEARRRVRQTDLFICRWHVGGPAVRLMPDYDLSPAMIGDDMPGVLQRVNPLATRTTIGCPHRCRFCGVRKIDGPAFRELADWPDLPVIADNNLCAASDGHLGRVVERLARWGWCDIQGVDCRLLTAEHARMFATVKRPTLRLALDNDAQRETWATAWHTLRSDGIAKANIRSYVLIGFDDDPDSAKSRCDFIESFGAKALPMWFHPLDAMQRNVVTPEQTANGWTKRKQRELMCWYYQHRTLEVRG